MFTKMKFFCINLPGAVERRRHCELQFEAAGIDVTFIRGFDGRASRLYHEEDWISCQIGACISHIMAVEEIRHNEYGPTLIFEDDVVLETDFAKKLETVLYALPEDWDVAALSWFPSGDGAEFRSVNQHWQKFTAGDVWGQDCYLVNGAKGAEAIMNCITPVRSHIDRMFWESCRDERMNGYFIKKQFVKQGGGFPSQNI
jgi:GR25 family glycosyltransferase involved in LPS biosynthesis